MEQIDLCGTGVALVTPFKENYAVDYEALGQIIDHVIKGGVNYLVVMGTTGESVTVSKEERKEIISFIEEKNNKRVPLVLGIGGYNTFEVAEVILESDLSAFGAILSVSPYYNKPTQEGIYQHYKFIAERSGKPIILYNVPGRTGKNIEAKTTLRLALDFKNIVGIKEASGDLGQIMEIIRKKPSEFVVISGDDALTFPIMSLGGCGVISVIANAFPADFSTMVNLLSQNKIPEARVIQYKLLEMIRLMFEEGSPAGVKAALNKLGLCKNLVRLPLVKVSDGLYERISLETDRIRK